jgi:Fur family transcriptional regulator, ferric uptake regulator
MLHGMLSRNTKTKALVEKIFQGNLVPLSIQDVFSKVSTHYPKTAYSTVYRIILGLAKEKKLIQVDWRERGSYFEWANRGHHHHLICRSCGDVTDIDDSLLGFEPRKITSQTGFAIQAHSIEITGVCAPCQSHTKG